MKNEKHAPAEKSELNTLLCWRKVEDELPKEGQLVWYYFDITGVNAGQMEKTEHGIAFFGEHGFLVNDVTHWMPIDEHKPPKPTT